MSEKRKILISCNMGIQHFYFVKSFVDKYNKNDIEFYILFQTHLEKKLTVLEKIRNIIKKRGMKGLINRVINKNIYANIMNKERDEYYKKFYPNITLEDIEQMISKKNIMLTHDINLIDSIKFVKEINPDLFLLQGGKIIKNDFLNNLNCHILHLHLGIVPLYRGGNSQFWTIYNNAIEENGFTIQTVDLGIDTGAIYIRKYVTDFSINDTEYSMYCKTHVEGIKNIMTLIDYYLKNNNLPRPIIVKEKGYNYGGNLMVESAKEYVYKNRKRVLKKFLKYKSCLKYPIEEINVIK